MNQVAESEELQARIGEEIGADALIALGADHGCEFTVEDLRAAAATEMPGELSDEQLEAVAGGVVLLVILAAKSPNRSGGGTGFRVKLPMQG
mgnify:CR=1 FL=1